MSAPRQAQSKRAHGPRAWALLGLWSACAALQPACQARPTSQHVALAARAADKQLEDIPTTAVSGTVAGRAFHAADVRVRIITMPGRERVDVLLSETAIKRCGLPLATEDRRVWLRWPGKPVLDGTAVRSELGAKGPLSAHYELIVDKQWMGHGGGAALLSLQDAGFGKYKGALWVCFDDAQRSCVAGSFEARACRSELDVDDSVWGAARLDSTYAEPRPQRAAQPYAPPRVQPSP